MKVYGIKNCDTVKKATTYLNQKNIDYTFIDLKKETIESSVLVQWAISLGLTVLINTKSATYRALDDTTKQNLSVENCSALITSNQSIMKRPIIIHKNGDITVGFNDSVKDKING